MDNATKVPEIRFKGFTDPWEQRKFSELYRLVSEKNDMSFGRDKIISVANMYFNPVAYITEDSYLSTYNVMRLGDIAFEGNRSKKYAHGRFVENTIGDGIVSHVFKVFRPNGDDFDLAYWKRAINNERLMKDVLTRSTKASTMMHELVADDFLNEITVVPGIAEQKAIGSALDSIDSLITLHQRKCERLRRLKAAMLDKMFPKPGELYPEIRFEGFADPWEQRKFSELVVIERGGSPRPIDDFITEEATGLNWVKIGDAPSLGRYITHTAEKIKPEGLPKTRQVYPGDLVLSNSMSFGRPYIMAVEGCIHDGWLLIRDTQNKFDPVYLCHMLGTPYMLNQYRMFAAGSTVNNLNKELVGNAHVPVPCKAEQGKVGSFLDSLDNLITLHQRKCERLKRLKAAMLDKMFV